MLRIPFKIATDCRAFTLTMQKKDPCTRVARWAIFLQDFQYTIEHRPGSSMRHVDTLSRYPLPSCFIVDECQDGLVLRLKKAQRADEHLKKITCLAEQSKIDGYVVKGGLLFKEVDGDVRLVVPKSMASQIIRSTHERGHFSVAKTEELLKRDFWIVVPSPK